MKTSADALSTYLRLGVRAFHCMFVTRRNHGSVDLPAVQAGVSPSPMRHWCIAVVVAALTANAMAALDAPAPMVKWQQPVDWWFVFKFNTKSFPKCGDSIDRVCPFGGSVQPYKQFGQQFAVASSLDGKLTKGKGCVGETAEDPVGSTFAQIYAAKYFYVIWNDQFYDSPKITGCTKSCSSPWGHSKGILSWNETGEGMVMQVTTPSWPASGYKSFPRDADGNTLGCVIDDNVKVSQHFFAMKLNRQDVGLVLSALANASVVTNPLDRTLVNNGGPPDIKNLVNSLGKKASSDAVFSAKLSNGVQLISKPSNLNVPPWQMVSSLLGGIPLRTATWWASPRIYSTTDASSIRCWSPTLKTKPGQVQIATTGEFEGATFGLQGGPGPDFNHAKLGVSISASQHLTILGDMNQQGTLSGTCNSSQNGRGGLFYVLDDPKLFESVSALISGDTAPIKAPRQ